MSAPLSVVIPTLNAAEEIGPVLARLADGVMTGLVREVIVTDGGSTDAIADIADAVGAELVTGAPGRGGQLGRGAEAARGDWLLFLHADTLPPSGWEQVVAEHIAEDARAAVFRLTFDERGFAARFVAGWANWRTRLFALPFGDQGLLISRALYREVGGYPDIPLMEDVAIVNAVGRRRLRLLPASVATSAARYRRDGWLRRGWRNWRCLAMYYRGVDPAEIAERYR